MTAAYEIRKYTKTDYDVFKKMFTSYFIKDVDEHLTDEEFDSVCRDIETSAEKQIVCLDLLFIADIAKGFIEYQIDSPESDWCEKEGYGMMRELYIDHDIRKMGYGRKLVVHSEKHLINNLSVSDVYLTASKCAIPFWVQMGYHDSGEICLKNEQKIYIKQVKP